MKALILAGGKGTRLRPYTSILPKPLMPVGEVPILEIILRQLKSAGVTEAILAVGYLRYLMEAYFGDGGKLGIPISYVYEEQPLGTAGPIALALDRLDDDFIVMNGDILTTLDYRALVAAHHRAGAAATIAVNRREVKIDFGVIEKSPARDLARYIEKPTHTFDVSMGINVLNRARAAKFLVPGVPYDIPALMTALHASGERVHCFDDPCYWLDIGRVEDYETAQAEFEARKHEFLRDTFLRAA